MRHHHGFAGKLQIRQTGHGAKLTDRQPARRHRAETGATNQTESLELIEQRRAAAIAGSGVDHHILAVRGDRAAVLLDRRDEPRRR